MTAQDPDALDEALAGGVDVLVDVVAYDDRQAAPLLARADRIGSAVVVSSAAVYVDAAGNGFETDEFAAFPVPIAEDQPTVAPGATPTPPARSRSSRRGRPRPSRRRSCARAPSTAPGASSRASGRS